MIAHPEILLLIGMAGLYLYDSAMLLDTDEAILSVNRKGRWRILFGAVNYPLRGKEPLLPNPFLPCRPLFKLRWSLTGEVSKADRRWSAPDLKSYRMLCPLLLGMAVGLFVLLPIGLFSHWGNRAIIAGIVVFYINLLVALFYIGLRRDRFGLILRDVASLAFESLTCPPFALNIVRRISLKTCVAEDLLSVGRRLLPAADWPSVLKIAIERIETAMDWADENSPESHALADHHAVLLDEMRCSQSRQTNKQGK